MDTQDLRIGPAAPSGAVEPARPAVPERRPPPAPGSQGSGDNAVAAATGGQLRNAYAQFVIDSESHDVVVRIRDAATDQVLQELPSPEVRALMRRLNEYSELMARRRAAAQGAAGA